LVTAKLKKDAYIVLRFWDDQIEKDIEASVKKISMTLAKIKDKKD
jgi:very-short-patch-repair endonuclease